jgi:hypothetical protein
MLVAPVDEGDGGFLSSLKKAGVTARGFQQMIPHSRQYAGLDDKEDDGRPVQVREVLFFFFSLFYWKGGRGVRGMGAGSWVGEGVGDGRWVGDRERVERRGIGQWREYLVGSCVGGWLQHRLDISLVLC